MKSRSGENGVSVQPQPVGKRESGGEQEPALLPNSEGWSAPRTIPFDTFKSRDAYQSALRLLAALAPGASSHGTAARQIVPALKVKGTVTVMTTVQATWCVAETTARKVFLPGLERMHLTVVNRQPV